MTRLIYPNPTPVMPQLNGFSVVKKPTFASVVAEAVSGREISSTNSVFPLWEYELTYEVLRTQTQNIVPDSYYANFNELEQLVALFAACAGQYGRFFYDDLTDDSRTGQFIAFADGVTRTFRAIRTWGTSGTYQIYEPVGGINTSKPYTVYVNGTPTAVTIDADGQSFVFAVAPTTGATITADYWFYYLCRFLEDVNDFDQFYNNLWQLKTLKFRSVKDGNWYGTGYRAEGILPIIPGANNILFNTLGTANMAGFDSPTINLKPVTLPSALAGDIVLVVLLNAIDNNTTPQTIVSMTSTTGLSFGRFAQTSYTDNSGFGPTAINLEIWGATTPVALTSEAINITLSAQSGVACMAAISFTHARFVVDPFMTPTPTDSSDVSTVNLTINTAYPYDLLLWTAGGHAFNNNAGRPTGFANLVASLGSVTSHNAGAIGLQVSYALVSTLQTGLNLVATTSPGPGNCACLGLESA